MNEPRLEVLAGQEKGSIARDQEAGVIYCHAADVDELRDILCLMKYRGDRQRPEWPENVWEREWPLTYNNGAPTDVRSTEAIDKLDDLLQLTKDTRQLLKALNLVPVDVEEATKMHSMLDRALSCLPGLWRGQDFDIATVEADVEPVVRWLTGLIGQK